MRWNAHAGHLQYLCSLDTDTAAASGDFGHKNYGPGFASEYKMSEDTLPCKLGILYPYQQAFMSGKHNIQTTLVSNQTALWYDEMSDMISWMMKYMK